MKRKEIIFKINLTIIMIIALLLGLIGSNEATNVQEKKKIGVMYDSHIQYNGWEKSLSKKDGATSGTHGESKRLEGIHIKLYGEQSSNIGIKYQTHIQNIGWQNWKKNGEMSGTQGQELRLEAIKIELTNTEEYSIAYRVHVQNIGWQEWRYDGEIAGTEGQALRLEAIEIKIIDKRYKSLITIDTPYNNSTYNSSKSISVAGWKMANISNTKIKAYVDNKQIDEKSIKYSEREDVLKAINGYGSKTQNPKPGFSFNIDAKTLKEGKHKVEIVLYTKDNKEIGRKSLEFVIDNQLHVKYSTHVQYIGWQNTRVDGKLAGTTGEAKRVEAIKINSSNLPQNARIKYQAHVQYEGWQNWKNEGEIAGTTGKERRMEAIRIKLEGTEKYSITYRVHVQNQGWQEWCYDGETAGTVGEEKRIEAIEIKIAPKITKNKTIITIEEPTTNVSNETAKLKGWVMTTEKDIKFQISIDGKQISTSSLKRQERQDIKNTNKGYGDDTIYNKNPGFEINIDYSKYALGKHKIKINILNAENKVIHTKEKEINIHKKISYGKGVYGKSGRKVANSSQGHNLEYYKYGNGPNVFFATFAIHGFEDGWNHDGMELVEIANDFYKELIDGNNYDIAEKWTIYIFPGINPDGILQGYTNNGPGRTTLYSQAPENKGIDLNRCWQIGDTYQKFTDSRNYNGTTGFQAYEAQYLRTFLLNNKSKNGQTILVDLHGWTQQLIGDSQICSYYNKQFSENDKSAVGRYGTGYLIDWARNSLGNSKNVAKSALIELPKKGINNHQDVLNHNFSNRYIQATLDMLRNI